VKNEQKSLFAEIIATLPDGTPHQVCIGLHWTAVVMDVGGHRHCGLASTLNGDHHHGLPDVPQAGTLETLSGLELAALTQSEQPTLVSVGTAAINALLPQQPDTWVDLNAEEVIASRGVDKSVVLIGHFPFVDRLRTQVGKLTVLELNPRLGDLPESAAEEAIPNAQVVAITGMSLLNHTFDGLLDLCAPDALVILLGPSVPLSPMLFSRGIEILCGSVVTSIDPVLAAVRQGANFRQVHRAGVRLVTITKHRVNV
jgi:uncharacterized protein (DUF4213/DUF364 family)